MANCLTRTRDRRRMAEAQHALVVAASYLEAAAFRLDEIRLNAETRACTAGADWWDSAAGKAHTAATNELRAEATALRAKKLPDLSRLR